MLTAVVLAAALVLAQAASPPVAGPTAAEAPAKAKAEKPKKPKMICTDETPVGSMIAKRTCRTPEEAAAEREAAQRNANDTIDHMRACRGGPGC